MGTLEDGSHWELSRIYRKFYDLQVALLQQFPKESVTPQRGKYLLYFIPVRVKYVTDASSRSQ